MPEVETGSDTVQRLAAEAPPSYFVAGTVGTNENEKRRSLGGR
jgi:hypothetical protein